MSPRIFVVTEGQTETAFVKKVLAVYFTDKTFIPIEVETKVDKKHGKQYKGGISNFEKVRNTLSKTIKIASKDSSAYVTTMFDFYGLPNNTPSFDKLKTVHNPYEKVDLIEKAIEKEFSFHRFFPYIQLHEFEALLYSDLNKLQEECFESDISDLRAEVMNFKNPELINGGTETAPSKRIIKHILSYDKKVNGINVIQEIGIDNLCKKCEHFSKWIDKIRNIK